MDWSLSFVVRRADGVGDAYVISDLQGHKEERTEAVANLHTFRRGRLTDDQLVAEATAPREYHIARVRRHYIATTHELVFLVDWVGYILPEIPKKTKDGFNLADCHWVPQIQGLYQKKKHHLTAAVSARKKALGLLPRA